MKPTSAAADLKKLAEELRSIPYKTKEYDGEACVQWADRCRVLNVAAGLDRLEAQQTDDTLSELRTQIEALYDEATENNLFQSGMRYGLKRVFDVIDELNSPHSPGEGKAGKKDSGSNDRKVRTSPSLRPDTLSELRKQIKDLPVLRWEVKGKVVALWYPKDELDALIDSAEAGKK